jgi:cyanate permease
VRATSLRPLTVLTGIILGSAAATTFGLGSTLVIFLVLSGRHPEFRAELPLLGVYVALFAGLTALAAVSFIGQARERPWRRRAQLAMWSALAALAALYWSTRR